MLKTLALACTALTLFAPVALAAGAGNAEAGRQLVVQSCSTCHASPTALGGTDAAPPFTAIARDYRGNPALIRSFLMGMHAPMQGLTLTRQQIDDVSAYLASLPAE